MSFIPARQSGPYVLVRVTLKMPAKDFAEIKRVAKRNGWPSWHMWMECYASEGIEQELFEDGCRREGYYGESEG